MRTPRRFSRGSLLSLFSALLLLGGLLVAGPAGADGYYLCSGYAGCNSSGMSDAGYGAASGTSYWNMYPGHNCTNYVAYRLAKNGVNATYLSGTNATNWSSVAQSHGVAVDKTPTVGSIAWWPANAPGIGSLGHVAYVESVGANGVLKISEDNYGGDFHWVYVYPGSTGYYPYGFIHFTPAASANGATLHTTDTNRLYRVAGGAPLLVSACPDNCTAAIQTTQAAVDRMAAVPANGTALRAVENGSIYRVVGGAPLWINACVDNACAAFVQVTQSTIDQLDHLRSRPADGSFVRAADTGSIYRIAGGAPMWLNGCVDTACRDFVNVNQWTVNTLNHLNPVPVNRTAVRAAETGAIYRVAGGAPMWLSSCIDDVCQNFVTVNQHTIDSLDHLTGRPADRTDLRSTNSGAIYRIVSGQPMWLAACVDTACQDFVNVTGSTLATKYGVS